MSFLNDAQKVFTDIKGNAKKTFDIKLLSLKIHNYEKELTTNLIKLGELTFESANQNNINLNLNQTSIKQITENINNLKYRISKLKTEIENYKQTQTTIQVAITKENDDTKFSKLKINANDLILKRTEKGVVLVRKCLICNELNSSSAKICSKCGAELLNPAP